MTSCRAAPETRHVAVAHFQQRTIGARPRRPSVGTSTAGPVRSPKKVPHMTALYRFSDKRSQIISQIITDDLFRYVPNKMDWGDPVDRPRHRDGRKLQPTLRVGGPFVGSPPGGGGVGGGFVLRMSGTTSSQLGGGTVGGQAGDRRARPGCAPEGRHLGVGAGAMGLCPEPAARPRAARRATSPAATAFDDLDIFELAVAGMVVNGPDGRLRPCRSNTDRHVNSDRRVIPMGVCWATGPSMAVSELQRSAHPGTNPGERAHVPSGHLSHLQQGHLHRLWPACRAGAARRPEGSALPLPAHRASGRRQVRVGPVVSSLTRSWASGSERSGTSPW